MPDFDTSVPHIARVYDYWLGGKDNFAADRELGERTLQAYPNLVFSVRANRAFLARTVRFLAAEAGIRQFLDIGTGIPTNNNTHQVAQAVAPEARIVYVDNDPIVLSHARALLTSKPEGACAYIDADVHDPDKILATAADTLDFSQPVALMLVAFMHFIGDAIIEEIRHVAPDKLQRREAADPPTIGLPKRAVHHTPILPSVVGGVADDLAPPYLFKFAREHALIVHY